MAGTQQAIKLPADCADRLPANRPSFQLIRRFGRPTGMETGEKAWLELAGIAAAELQVTVNGHLMQGDASHAEGQVHWRAEITDLFQPRNELKILIGPADQGPAGILGGVQLLLG